MFWPIVRSQSVLTARASQAAKTDRAVSFALRQLTGSFTGLLVGCVLPERTQDRDVCPHAGSTTSPLPGNATCHREAILYRLSCRQKAFAAVSPFPVGLDPLMAGIRSSVALPGRGGRSRGKDHFFAVDRPFVTNRRFPSEAIWRSLPLSGRWIAREMIARWPSFFQVSP